MLEADLPDVLKASWLLDAEGGGGGGGGGLGRGAWAKVTGLLAGVPAAEDPPLSKAKLLRPERAARGDGDSPEPSDSPVLESSWARHFPLLTAGCESSACLRQNSRSLVCNNAWRSVFPVKGFWGIRLHPCFCFLHHLHGLFCTTSQLWPPFMHQWHCHPLLPPSQLRGW